MVTWIANVFQSHHTHTHPLKKERQQNCTPFNFLISSSKNLWFFSSSQMTRHLKRPLWAFQTEDIIIWTYSPFTETPQDNRCSHLSLSEWPVTVLTSHPYPHPEWCACRSVLQPPRPHFLSSDTRGSPQPRGLCMHYSSVQSLLAACPMHGLSYLLT